MSISEEWKQGHENRIVFVMIDGAGVEVTGLGSTYTLSISKNGGAFAPSAGVKAEIGSGFYTYLSTVGEADTPGPVAITVTHASTRQQNLEYVVATRIQNTKSYTYPVTSSAAGNPPVPNAAVDISTDAAKANIIWSGYTDEFGHARDSVQALPVLQIGKDYYFWTSKVGFTFTNPDLETIS
jgi:hypothetical protein